MTLRPDSVGPNPRDLVDWEDGNLSFFAVSGNCSHYEPSQEEVQAYCELSERGSFRPFYPVVPKARPSHATNRWGKAVAAHQAVQKRRPDR